MKLHYGVISIRNLCYRLIQSNPSWIVFKVVARTHAAAWSSQLFFYLFLFLVSFLLSIPPGGRAELLIIREQNHHNSYSRQDFIPPELQRTEETLTIPPLWPKRQKRHRKQKRGKQGGLRARLQANAHRPALHSLFLPNARSLANKMDEIRLRIAF